MFRTKMDFDEAPTSSARLEQREQASSEFALSRIFQAHNQDVKRVVGIKTGSLLTAGRDGAMKLWTERAGTYVEAMTIWQQDNLVINSADCYKTADDEWLLFAGRKDGTIAIFSTGSSEPIRVLHGHRLNVCALYIDSTTGIMLSGSFDHTALVWPILDAIKVQHLTPGVLEGHSNSIWAVASVPTEPLSYLTGSADQLIKLFDYTNTAIKTFRGHSDVVRQLQVLSTARFVSASNDSTLRIWDIETVTCLQVFHSSFGEFIYDISKLRLKNGDLIIIACGEKGYVEVVNLIGDTHLYSMQTIRTPVYSVWSVSPLRNGDFALGTNTGQVFIYTQNESRQALEATNAQFSEQLSFLMDEETARQELAQDDVIKINVELDEGRTFELQYTKGTNPVEAAAEFIRIHGLPLHYLDEITQFLVANIPEAKAAMNLQKITNNGITPRKSDVKKYDYEFPVTIKEGNDPVILGYNIGEDPDYVAQCFAEKYNLPISLFSKIAALIREQVPEHDQSGSSGYFDPFTGSNRYVPTKNQAVLNKENGFTNDKKKPRSELAPLRKFFTFDLEGASTKVLSKLKESNESQTELKLTDDELKSLGEIMSPKSFTVDDLQISGFDKCLMWQIEKIVPSLDIFRTSLLNEQLSGIFLDVSKKGTTTIKRLMELLTSDSEPVRILVCRAITNALAQKHGQALVMTKISTVSNLLVRQISSKSKPALQIAASSGLANISRHLLMSAEKGEKVTELGPREDVLTEIVDGLKNTNNFGDFSSIALIRILQALVTLMWGTIDIIRVGKNCGVVELVNKIKDALHEETGKLLVQDIIQMTFP